MGRRLSNKQKDALFGALVFVAIGILVGSAVGLGLYCAIVENQINLQAPITSGIVVGKEFVPAHTETEMTPVNAYSGSRYSHTQFVSTTTFVPDKYTVTIQQTDDNGDVRTATWRVSEDVYDNVNVGEWFDYQKNMEPDCPESYSQKDGA